MAIQSNNLVTPIGPITGSCKLTAANTNYDAPTAPVDLLPTADVPDGARITSVAVEYGATATAHDCQLYARIGATYRHLKTVAVASKTISAGNTTAIDPIDFGYSDTSPLYLKAGEGLAMAISVTQTAMHGRCEGGMYGTPAGGTA